MKGLLGRKLGMTQLFQPDGRIAAVTVLEAGPCVVVRQKTEVRDGYDAVQLAFGVVEPRRLNKPLTGHLAKAGAGPHRHLVEVRGAHARPGSVWTVEVFSPQEEITVTATSKGKGFAGLVKRHAKRQGKETHGSHNIRQPGSIGSVDAARVFRGLKLPGHLGARRTTTRGLHVAAVDKERNLLLVRGAVPGAKGAVVYISAPSEPAEAAAVEEAPPATAPAAEGES
jgi:large subunit ribosomal protein L3